MKNESLPQLPAPDKVPVLIPEKAREAIFVDGAYEFVEAIKYPTEGTGGIYTKEYFASLIDYMKNYPIPGSKDGHESQSDDFYTVGGELQETSNGEGVCYFHMVVPPEDFHGGSNAGLIRSLKAGVPELSLVADVEPERGNDGKSYFRKEMGRPRNDIVPEGAMEVTINSLDEKEIMALIKKGAVDMDSESKELVKNGKVYRKAAVALQSTSEKAKAGRVLNAIAVWKNKSMKTLNPIRRNGMLRKFHNEDGTETALTKEDVIAWLKNAIANNSITSEELMKEIGFENKLRKSEDDQREELAEAIIETLELPTESTPEQIIEAVKEVLEENEAVQDELVEAAANELANGKKITNAEGKEEDNPCFLYARNQLSGLRGKQLNSAAEKLKTDPVMVTLRSKQADTRVNAAVKSDEEKKSELKIREC